MKMMNNETTQATIKDIAARAGVSIATVDRVLHNRGKVSEKNLSAIQDAIRDLDYQPNPIARALSARRNKIKIGLVLPNVESDFWNEIISGTETAQKQLEPFGVELIPDYAYSYELDDQIKSIDRLIAQEIQGLILVPLYDGFGNIISSHIPAEIPFGTVICDIPESTRLFHVGPDDFAMGSLAARLCDLFCRHTGNVVILAPNHALVETQKRISGFVSKINQEKLQLNLLRVVPVRGKTEEVMYRNMYESALECLRQCPDIDAFYITNGLTEWCASAVKDSGIDKKRIIIGHEITQKTFDYLQQDLIHAVLYQRPSEQIITAIQLMYQYLVNNEAVPENNIVSECSIILKENMNLSVKGGFYGNC